MKTASRNRGALAAAALAMSPVIPSIQPWEHKADKEPNLSEVMEAVRLIGKAHDEHKKAVEEKLETLKKGGSTSAVDEKLAKISSDLDKGEKVQNDFLKKLERIEEERKKLDAELEKKFEARFNRMALGAGGDGSAEGEAKARRELERKVLDKVLRGGKEAKANLTEDERKVLVISNDSTGGYLATPELVKDIIKAEVLYSPMRDLVTLRNIGKGELIQPKRTGTASATRQGETSTRAETNNPSWGLLRIQAPEMYAEARVSRQNLEDSDFDLLAILRDEFGEQFGVLEGQEVISGTGINSCLGILDANAAGPGVPLAYTPSGSAATIASPAGGTGDGLITFLHSIKSAYAANGRFALNRLSLGKVRQLKDSQGRYLWEPSLVPSAPSAILGLPYTECPDMPDEGANAFPIAAGDWRRAYTLVQRVDIQIMEDPYTLQSNGQIKFTARRRVGGQVMLGEAIRLYKCSVS